MLRFFSRTIAPLALAVLAVTACSALAAPVPDSCAALRSRLMSLAAMSEAPARDALLDSLWSALRREARLPFVTADSVLFLYRGRARTVTFTGDFDGWQPDPPRATPIPGTDVWYQLETFPHDARLDYKIVSDGRHWLLDPENPRVQKGGYGDNSELRMPGYIPSPWVTRRPDVPSGILTASSLDCPQLGYPIAFQVYTPAGYAAGDSLPAIYVTDGQEYADPRMGSMVQVLDNLIAADRLRPIIAVFIDPRVKGRNLRAEQYILNEGFAAWVRDRLVPHIDARFHTSPDRMDRGILGTSLGGLNAAWFALRAAGAFGRIGIQSPAFQAGEGRILGMFAQSPRLDVDIFLTWGTQHDFGPTTRQFRELLDRQGYEYHILTVNEGHSWGAWRAQLDDILTAFWPAGDD